MPSSKMRVFFMRVECLVLDTFYPIPIQLQVIDQIASLFYLFLIFQIFHFAKDKQLINNILFYYRTVG